MNINHIAAKILTPGLKKFSNLHKGETCYIFGDGPSIKWFDLRLLNDHPAICCGMIPFHKDFNKLDVKYAALVAPWLFVPKIFQPKIYHPYRMIASEYEKFIFCNLDKEFFVSLTNFFSLSGKNINYVFRGLPDNRNRTDEALSHYELFGGSFHATLALAYYLGFYKVYLVGFDAWTIRPQRNIRFYEFGMGDAIDSAPYTDELLEIFKSEMDICTISFDGSSGNLKNIKYKDYTGKVPVYKENNAIMSTHYLNILDSYPGYRIFQNKLK